MATPEAHFVHWQRLVEKVEAGYDELGEEYVNELYIRDSLEDMVSMVSPSSQERLLEAIRPWDRRFESATRAIPRALRPWRWEPRRWWWWWYPLPLDYGPDLEGPLRHIGVL
jgi:hypothetical protein